MSLFIIAADHFQLLGQLLFVVGGDDDDDNDDDDAVGLHVLGCWVDILGTS